MLSKTINYREHPELYRVQKGEQGVLTCEPYKSELLPHWRFKDPEAARRSVRELSQKFREYLEDGDFAGMDMARKFIQMGFTRSRRYANRRSGRKYAGTRVLPLDPDPVKEECAAIFKEVWQEIERNEFYREMKREWRLWYG